MTISELKPQYVFQTLGIAAYVTEHASELKGAKGDGGEKGDKGDTGAGRASGTGSGTVHSSFRRGAGIIRRVSSERTIRAAARMILMASGMYLLGASLQKGKGMKIT